MSRWRLSVFVLCVAAAIATLHPPLGAAAPNRAGLVVRSSDESIVRMCVFFESDEISGLDLIERAGLPLVTDRSSVGTAICKIGAKGCASGDCFCKYPTFWGYWTRDHDEWKFSDVGAADRTITDGDVDGWSWGKDGKPPPPDVSFDELCTATPQRSGGAKGVKATEVARATSAPLAQPEPLSNTRGNYVAFAGFLAFFIVAGAAAYIRRRR